MMFRSLVVLAMGTALAGCSSFSIPSMGGGSSSSGVSVRAESNPSGAEARAQSGATCRTPCTLDLPASGAIPVTFTLQGYLPQTAIVNVSVTRESADLPDSGTGAQISIEPNPVFAQLELAPPPPPPPRKKPAPRKPKPQPAQAPPPPPPPAQGFGPPPQQPGFH